MKRVFALSLKGYYLKKTFTLITLISLCLAALVLTVVHGQNSTADLSKFRRTRADKRLPNQYSVVLKNNVADVDSEAGRLARDFSGDRNGGHTYRRALK